MVLAANMLLAAPASKSDHALTTQSPRRGPGLSRSTAKCQDSDPADKTARGSAWQHGSWQRLAAPGLRRSHARLGCQPEPEYRDSSTESDSQVLVQSESSATRCHGSSVSSYRASDSAPTPAVKACPAPSAPARARPGEHGDSDRPSAMESTPRASSGAAASGPPLRRPAPL